jgi:integrase
MKLDKKLTDALARTVKLKPGEIAWDADVAGFGVRSHLSGARSWHVQYDAPGGRTRPMSLGPIEKLPAGKARTTAIEILAKARLGQDPAGEKRKARDEAAETFAGHLKRYLDFKRKTRKPRTVSEIERHLTKDAASLHPRPIRQIDRKQAASLLAKVADNSGDRAADTVRASASAYYTWLMREGLAEANPFAGTAKRVNNKHGRERVPTMAELVEIWNACDDDRDHSAIVRLLILGGARRNEIGGLEWCEVDFNAGVLDLPASRMKHNRPHLFALSGAAVKIIRGRKRGNRKYVFGRDDTGFSGWSRALKNLRARIQERRRKTDPDAEDMPHFTPHDFRRSISTTMGEVLDIPPHIVSEVLAHLTFKQGSEGTYNKAKYLPQKRAAIERWAAYLLAAVEGGAGTTNVVPLAKPLPASHG